MKKIIVSTIAISSLCAFSACGKKPEVQLSEYANEYAQILIQNDSDCAQAAAKIDEFAAKNGAAIAAAVAKINPPVADPIAAYVNEADKAKLKSLKCLSNPEVTAAAGKVALGVVAGAPEVKAAAPEKKAAAAPEKKADDRDKIEKTADTVGKDAKAIGEAAKDTIGAAKGIADAINNK